MEWTSIKFHLPEYDQRVLLHEVVKPEWEHLSVVIGRLMTTTTTKDGEEHSFVNEEYQPIDVTHWMPLPDTKELQP